MNARFGRRSVLRSIGCLLGMLAAAGCGPRRRDAPADAAGGRAPADFPELAADVFAGMDGGLALTDDEARGRNTWILWCGGDEQFWDRMARASGGLVDLLRTIDSRRRATRFRDLGLINEPGYRAASKPDEYGLWIDEPAAGEPAAVDPAVYGRATGIMGFRLFPNPGFDAAARARWDGRRYDGDPAYAAQPGLVRPYRVGISCGACHVAFNPLAPPRDPAEPGWANLASAIGNQYLREGRVFAPNARDGSFFAEMLRVQPPGTSDTSRIANDHINNPVAINAIFALGARLTVAQAERMSGETLRLPGEQPVMAVPHVLKDGADSVGVAGAILRVYVSIGLYSQHSLELHDVLLGLKPQHPFRIALAQRHSVYWLATQAKVPNVVRFLARLQAPRLEDAPGGRAWLTADPAVRARGQLAFADRCAGCHSSKQPPAGAEPKAWFRQAVVRDDFRDGNFFSNERRYPVSRIGTNADRALATNATAGHIWEAFSSATYKALPAAGAIQVYNPFTGEAQPFAPPAGGPGYYRPPSLLALWTSAPFFHNNALGGYTGDPSVAGRMAAFDDAAEKLLWPEKRAGVDSIWRTTRESWVELPLATIPEPLRALLRRAADPDGVVRLGPIPAGTPVALIANLDPQSDPAALARLCLALKEAFTAVDRQHLDAGATRALLRDRVGPALFAASKCPDLVTDRGHPFGADLPDADKRALIEYLKTL